MLICNKKIRYNYLEYGIEIPISNSKQIKTIEYLENQPNLKNHINKFIIKKLTEKITKKDLLRVHSKDYVKKLYSKDLEKELIRSYELIDENGNYNRYNPKKATRPLKKLFKNILIKVSGTYQCCLTALDKNFCFFFGGGMHHAKKNYGEGFCIVNDIVIAVRKLQAKNKIKNAWIIDVDAHKGDGTAQLTQNDKTIITLSIHMAKGWPLNKPKYNKNGVLNPSFIPSNIDIPISKGEEKKYLEKLKNGLIQLKKYPKPDITVVVLGSDPYEKDQLNSTKDLNLSLVQMKQRDLMIYNFLKNNKIPQAYLMAGGYGEYSWEVYAQFLKEILNEFI
jgi:acetoin utilization deacetylase AcuC-like enzyme